MLSIMKYEGWEWFDEASSSSLGVGEDNAAEDTPQELAARCFRGTDGVYMLAHLRKLTTERSLAPGAPESLLRHLEGQRQLVKYMEMLIAEGRAGSRTEHLNTSD
jgi:hypothetical protein